MQHSTPYIFTAKKFLLLCSMYLNIFGYFAQPSHPRYRSNRIPVPDGCRHKSFVYCDIIFDLIRKIREARGFAGLKHAGLVTMDVVHCTYVLLAKLVRKAVNSRVL